MQKLKLCSFTNLISQKFNDTAVVLAIASCCTLDLPVVNTQGSSTGFLFTYHSVILEIFFQRLLFQWIVDFRVPFSINFLSSLHFEAFEKLRGKTLCPLWLVLFIDWKISKHVWDLIFLHNNFIYNVFFIR